MTVTIARPPVLTHMEQHHLLSLLLLSLSALAFAQQCSISGDCTGTSLGIDVVNSERDCLEHCNLVEGCEWYSYDVNDGFCIALQDCPEVDSDCITCFHGENECELPLMCFEQGECLGTYISHVDVDTAKECLERCYNDDPDCKFFSFFAEDKICSFFETCSLDQNQTDAVSGERDCYGGGEQTRYSKIFLWDNTNTAWIHMPSMYESGNGTTCNQPAEYPNDSYGAVGQVINNSAIACGGFPSTNECFSLSSALNVWVEFPSMDVERSYAASVMSPNGWWATGGSDGDIELSSTSLWDGSAWTAGPDLPTGRYMHCMVQVNSSHSLMAGGRMSSGISLSDAYLFDWTEEVWTQLPDMTEEVGRMACTLYWDSRGEEYILTVGGYPAEHRQLVQSISLSKITEWEVLPELPTDVDWATFVHDGEELVIVNSYFGNLLRFDSITRTFTVIDGQTLPIDGPVSLVLAINDISLNGCI